MLPVLTDEYPIEHFCEDKSSVFGGAEKIAKLMVKCNLYKSLLLIHMQIKLSVNIKAIRQVNSDIGIQEDR